VARVVVLAEGNGPRRILLDEIVRPEHLGDEDRFDGFAERFLQAIDAAEPAEGGASAETLEIAALSV
jgi:hypothetical protein